MKPYQIILLGIAGFWIYGRIHPDNVSIQKTLIQVKPTQVKIKRLPSVTSSANGTQLSCAPTTPALIQRNPSNRVGITNETNAFRGTILVTGEPEVQVTPVSFTKPTGSINSMPPVSSYDCGRNNKGFIGNSEFLVGALMTE